MAQGQYYEDDGEDYYEGPVVDGRAFCDSYDPHEAHVYTAINCNVYSCPGLTEAQLAEMERESEATCEHGLSAWLCSGPNHYGEWPNW